MIKSMTGYGRASQTIAGMAVTVERKAQKLRTDRCLAR